MQLFFWAWDFLLAPCIIHSFSEAPTPRRPRPDSSISIFLLKDLCFTISNTSYWEY